MAGKRKRPCNLSYLSNFKLDLETLQELRRNNGEGCDAFLKGSGSSRRIPCHRIVLSSASPFFREQLTGHKSRRMTLDSIESKTLEIIIEYGNLPNIDWENEINLLPENVFNIFNGARVLKLGKLEADCFGYLRNLGRPELLIRALESALVTPSNEELLDVCIKFILEHFEEAKVIGLGNLRFGIMRRIVTKSVESGLLQTEQILEAVIDWLEKNPQERHANGFALIKDIPLRNLEERVLAKFFLVNEFMGHIPQFPRLFYDSLEAIRERKRRKHYSEGGACM